MTRPKAKALNITKRRARYYFFEKLKASAVTVEMKIFPKARHNIPIDEKYREIYLLVLAKFLC
jgi:dipeptidyl aminopeptidase/acylaminoacyl peptidase